MTLNRKLWLLWFLLAACAGTALVAAMVYGGPLRSQFLIGKTTSGHHQIELACDTCHAPFGGKEAMQKACLSCHNAELKLANDSHPAKKFTDPRNADRLVKLNATLCVTCHREHNPQVTGAMGLTLPGDYCVLCHQDVGKDRPSHVGLPFNGCAAAGCHNFHDNRALYEDFLEKHAGEPELRSPAVFAVSKPAPPADAQSVQPLSREAADAPADKTRDAAILADWHATAHARAGVNCKGCHAPKNALGEEAAWTDKPDKKICTGCHQTESQTFAEGKHGMRLKDGMLASHDGFGGVFSKTALSPMRSELARLPMSTQAHGT
jgi:predicted CXXCH cytochrome family protein